MRKKKIIVSVKRSSVGWLAKPRLTNDLTSDLTSDLKTEPT